MASDGKILQEDGFGLLLEDGSGYLVREEEAPAIGVGIAEEQRTNLAVWSGDIGNAAWVGYTDSGSASRVSNSGLAPDGTGTATLVTVDRGASSFYAQGSAAQFTSAGGAYTGSIWLKAYQASDVGRTIDIALFDGTLSASPVVLTASWVRYTKTTTLAAGAAQFITGYNSTTWPSASSATGPTQYLAWGGQAELGATVSSYILTTTAAVTRAATYGVAAATAAIAGAGLANVALGTGALVAQAAVAASTTGVSGSTSTGLDSVVFLSGFEGIDGSTTIIEEAKGKAVTVFGDAQIDTAQSKFGGSSLLLDGNGDYLSLADHADWTIGANQFTLEAWVKFTGTFVNNATIIAQASLSNQRNFYLFRTGNAINLALSTGTTATTFSTSGFTAIANTWYHIAADRDASNKVRIYVDGVMRGSGTYASVMANSTSPLIIGRLELVGDASWDFQGWIDELRFTNGIARYASDAGFTVPGAAFTRALTPQPATMIGAGTSSSAITDTTLNVGSAVVASTTGVSRSIAPSVALTAQAASAASTTGLSRSIATPVALAAQQSVISGLGGAGTTLVGTGVVTTRPALVAGAGVTASAGVGALQVSVATIDAHGVSAWIATAANLNVAWADIDGLGEIPYNVVVSGPYAQVGDLWEGAAVWGKIAGKWRRLRLWTKAEAAWGIASWDKDTQEAAVWSLPVYGVLGARGAHIAGSGFIRDQIWGAGDLVAGPALVTDSSSLSGLSVTTHAAWEPTPAWVKVNGKWRRVMVLTKVSGEWKRAA